MNLDLDPSALFSVVTIDDLRAHILFYFTTFANRKGSAMSSFGNVDVDLSYFELLFFIKLKEKAGK